MIQNDYLDMSIRYNMFKCSLKVIKYKNNWLSGKKKHLSGIPQKFSNYEQLIYKFRTHPVYL